MGLEPTTATLARWRSTTELRSPLFRTRGIYHMALPAQPFFPPMFGSFPRAFGKAAMQPPPSPRVREACHFEAWASPAPATSSRNRTTSTRLLSLALHQIGMFRLIMSATICSIVYNPGPLSASHSAAKIAP